jgi:hypothetical protein
MKLIQKALLCAIVTEMTALSFVALDRIYGMHSPTWRDTPMGTLRQTDYPRWRKVTFFWKVAVCAHVPARIVVGIVGGMVGTTLGVDAHKVFGDYTFGGPSPSWLLLGVVQAALWFCFWLFVLHLTTRLSELATRTRARFGRRSA